MTMDLNDDLALQDLLNAPLQGEVTPPSTTATSTPAMAPAPEGKLSPFLHRIPVTLTLEAGSARITLQELADLGPDSVVPLDTLVGEPLTIKVNGSAIGKGEIVVSGDAYGLRVLELNQAFPALAG